LPTTKPKRWIVHGRRHVGPLHFTNARAGDEHALVSSRNQDDFWQCLIRQDGPESVAFGLDELVPVAQFPIGYKSMNTHIHLLESFTQLYEVWKDPTVRRRIEELLAIIRDKVSVAPGVMNLYFSAAWVALPGHDSYGHDGDRRWKRFVEVDRPR
jgi:hypothetical protein